MAFAGLVFFIHGFQPNKKKSLTTLISANGGAVGFTINKNVCY
jgi:hypothetical protein